MRALSFRFVLRVLSPQVVARAIETFDRMTAMVLGAVWAAAALMIGFALYASNLASTARHAAEMAQVTEPALPVYMSLLK